MPKKEGKCNEEDETVYTTSEEENETSGDEFELVDLVWDFCNSSDINEIFESFIGEHMDELHDMAPLDCEQKLRHRELFHELLSICEEKVSVYIEDKGKTVEEFVTLCREILEREDVDQDLVWFVKKFLSCLEYDSFNDLVLNAIHGEEGEESDDEEASAESSKRSAANFSK